LEIEMSIELVIGLVIVVGLAASVFLPMWRRKD